MSDYVVMFPADRETEWEAGSEADHQAVYDTDLEFGRLLAQRGGRITGGAELATARRTHVVRRGPNGTALVTDGPYAESREWIVGFDVLECADLDEAITVASEHPMAAGGRLELRPFVED